ncbi:DUF5776 domain-containing protein [Apilactobacillus apinorum]|uniref:DUF5776 domain-containing protein n=1 Tax=Apilactobacillus apinorum TaxID=1218495 RepID=UPI0006B4958B|nr:DUF5776 domain-containing protein [Apilactobacillus apinorum]KOY69711.1 hypothetical protein RZ74_02100 [Apilactobacillus apinorum]CAI2623100.1 Hypothetical protein AAPFHON13_02160 [Apilactobacillus apinorum]
MQYNKKQFNKVNDKKVMKKVKKQWIVVSVSTLALLGASAYTVTNNHVSAKADTTSGTTTNSGSGSGSSGAAKSSGTSTTNSAAGSSNGTSVSNPAPSQTPITTQYAGSITSYNNNDDTATYANQIKQGYTDAYNKKGNQSSGISGAGANYYNAAYDGAQAAINAYNSATKNMGAGTQDYNYYGNTVTRQDGYQDDNANAQTGTQGSSGQGNNSQSSNAGSNSGSNNSASNGSTTSSATKNPTDGTPLSPNSYNDPNQGGADNPKDASNSVSNYETTMDGKLNNANNTSVKASNATQAISVPTASTASINTEQNKFSGAQGLSKAYSQAVTYVLTQQGMADAESGKWQGVYVGSNGQTQDYYLNSNQSNTTSAYDQAYRGARDAMNAFFTNNSYNGNTSVAQINTGITAYIQGYNDVVNQAANGIVYVQNGNQYSSIMTGSTNPNVVGGNIASGINVVRIANDIDLTGATNGENDGTVNTNFATFTVDGQNHMVDFHGNNYTVNRPGSGSLDIYLQNFQTMYGSNFFGTFRAEPGAAFHFSNLNYVGPQLLSSYSNDTYFSGNVNVVVPIHGITYTSPFQSGVTIEGNGNQENLEVNNFILQPNSHYFGNTSPALGGTNVVVTGNFTLGENAKMTLITRGGNGGAATIADGSTWGVWLKNAGASLNINKNATLNIIPQLYNNQKNLFGGAVYSGAQVSININGGTLNYEGYNGISGFYNQPVDLQGSSQTQINVINGGVMQILMDSIPDTTAWNSYNGHESVYDGLINNVGLGNFNVGARGNLKVGVTNSDSTYNVPYYGPININSVGSNHVIFLKSNAVQQFQTTTGTSGTGKAGNINAFTVGVKQADGSIQYLYNFNLLSGSTNYTGVDFNGNNVNGTINGNVLDISDIPAVQFVGPLSKIKNSDGSTTVQAYAKISNYSQFTKAFPTTTPTIYVGVATSPSAGTYNQMTQVQGQKLTDTFSKADPNQYTTSVSAANYDGGIIPISYNIPSGTDTTNVGMRLQFFINSVNTTLGPNAYTSTVEGYQAGANGKVVETSNGDMQIANGQLSNISAGSNDALADMVNGNSAAKNAESFGIQTNADYSAAYNSVQAGYQAFLSNPNADYTKLAAYINASNPTAFVQGFKQAAYQAGQKDAQFNKNNVSNISYPGAQALYTEAQTQYSQAYTDALQSAGQNQQQIMSQYNLPTKNSNGTAATAVTQAISDAYGVAKFIQDEQAGTISTTTNPTSAYNSLTSSQQIAYNDAYAGYQNALSVGFTDNNTDTNADKAESAGFDYAQSLINGGISPANPQSTASHMNQLAYAQTGYSVAQAAVSKAKSNGASSSDASNMNLGNSASVSSDGNSQDITAYQYIKMGAYTALQNKSDAGLNTMEKVGYSLVASSQAYTNGINSFDTALANGTNNSQTAPQTDNPISTSSVGQPQYQQGYTDAKNAYTQAISDAVATARAAGSNAANLPDTVSAPSSIPAGAQQTYVNAYKAAIDGYKDGNTAQANDQGPHYNNISSTNVSKKSYDNAYQTARADAGANDYVTKKSEAASDTPYVAGYSAASAGHSDGYSAASSAAQTNQTVPSAPANKPAQYVQGYQSGITDEQAEASAKIGASQYLSNASAPTTDSTKPSAYNQSITDGFNAAEAGFKDAMNQAGNKSTSYTGNSQTSYLSGYNAYNASTWNNDAASMTRVNVDSTPSVTSVTNDVFNATLAKIQGTNYTPAQSANGKLYQDISGTLGAAAQTSYNNGLSQVSANSNAQSTDPFAKAAIDDFNNGYNNETGNTNSTAYAAGQALLNSENSANTQANTDATQSLSDPNAQAALNAIKDAYSDVAKSGANPAAKRDLSNQNRAYQDAYNKAFDTANAQKSANQTTAVSAIASGQQNTPFSTNSASDLAWNSAYNDIKTGYQAAKNSSNPTNPNPNNANVTFGFNTANAYTASYQAAQALTTLPADHMTTASGQVQDVDAYNGAVDALNQVYTNGTTTGQEPAHLTADANHSADYVKAYNDAMDAAYAASQKGQTDMTAGTNSNTDSLTGNSSTAANKIIYQNAYKQAAIGFGSGLNSGSFPSNADRQKGYNAATGYGQQNGASLSQGYKDAVNDFMNNKGQSVSSHATEAGYADALAALNAANATPTQSDPSTSAISKYAYSQQLAAKNALVDASNNNNANQTAPSNVDQDVYNEAYQAVKDGYNDGIEQTTPTASDHKNQNDSALPYTASYQQGLTAGRILKGAQDYVAGKANATVQSTDTAYNQGVLEAQAGYTDGKNNNNAQATANSYSTNDAAYKLGQQAGANSKDGVSQANTTSSNDNGLSGDSLNAYYGVKDAYNAIKNPDSSLPSSGKNVDTNSQAYKDAYQNAQNAAKQAEQNGVSAFASQSGEPTTDGTIAQDAQKDGYDQAQAGYDAEKAALVNNASADLTSSSKNSSYNAGVQLAKDSATGQSDAYSGATPSNAAQAAAKQAVLDAYANVTNGTPDATPTPSDNTNKQVYNDAYSAAKTKAVQSANNGADSYLNGGQKSGQSDLDHKLSDAEFDKAQSGFNAGLSAAQGASSGSTDLGYNKGFAAGQQVAKAISDSQAKNTTSSSDSNYNNAVSGYQDALNGKTPQQTPATPAYTTAYNQAQTDLQSAYQDGVNQALKGLPAQSSYDPNKKATNVNGLSNSAVSTKANAGFNDVANGFNNEINNQLNNSQTPIANPNDANNQGTQLAKQVEQAISDAVNNGSNASFAANSSIQTEIQKGLDDANASDASSTAPNGLSPIAQLAYKEEYNKKTAQEQADIQTAKSHVLSGNTSGDNGNVQTYDGDIQQAISDAKSYQDNTSNKTGADQDAYKVGLQIGQNGLAKGAQSYVTGGTQNTDGSVEGQLESQGYTDASSGFAAGLTKPAGTSSDKPSNTSYTTGFNAAQAVKTAEANIENNTNNPSTDANSANQATQGYKDAAAAFASNANTSATETTSSNPAYKQAYSDAINHLQGKYSDGAGQFTSGKATPDTSSANSSYDKNAITQGFNAAQTGFNAGMNNTHDYDSDSNATSAQKTGYDLAQNVLASINSAKNTDTPTTTGDNNLDQAIKEARSNVIAHPVSSTDTSYPSDIQNNVLAQQVYKAAVDQFKQEYQAGVTAATSTNADGSAVQPDHTNTFVTNGVNDANTAMTEGFNAKTNTTELTAAYQAGVDAKSGVTEANNGQSVNANESAATQLGNSTAATAISNESHNPKITPDNSGKSTLYQLAYSAGQQQSDTLTTQGTNGFINGQNRPSGSDAASQLSQKAYDDALNGYNAAKNGNTSTANQSDAYAKGVKAYQDAQNGIAYAQQHFNDSSNGIPSGQDVTQAETLAAQAVMDAYKGNNPSNAGNPIYADAYNAEIQKKNSLATEGAKAGANANSDTPSSYPEGVTTPIDKASYAKGYRDAYDGYQTALQDITVPVPTVNSGVNQQDAQNGAVQAFKDVLAGGNPASLQAPTNASDAFKAAYAKALSDAQGYLSQGENDAKTGTAPTATGNGAEAQLINYAYNNVTNGYKSQRDNDFNNANNDTRNPNSYFQEGVTIAKDLKAKVDSFKSNPTTDGSLAAKAYQDGISGTTTNKPNAGSDNYLENNDLYNQIHDAAQKNAATGANAFVNGLQRDNSSATADDKAQQAGYDDASRGFTAGLAQPAGSTSDNDNPQQSPSYKQGQDAAIAVIDAEDNIENAHNNVPSDTASFAMAKSGYQDAYNAINNSSDPKNVSATPTGANANNPAYKQAYQDAIAHLKAQYQAGIDQFNNGNAQANTSGINGQYYQALIQKGFNAAQSALTNGLSSSTASTSDTAVQSTLVNGKIYASAISADATNDTNPSTGDTGVDATIKAAKSAVLSNPAVADNQYPTSNPNVSGNAKLQAIYKASVDAFEAQYNSGVNAVVSGDGNGHSGTTPSGTLASHGTSDATESIKAGFSGATNPHANLSAAYTAGQDAQSGMQSGQSGTDDSSSSDSAAKKSGNQAARDATSDITSGQSRNNSNALLTYQLAYDQAKKAAGNSANDGALALFNNNANNDPSVANGLMKQNPTTASDRSFNKGLTDAKTALTDAQKNDPSLDGQYDQNTVAGKVYFATKAAYSAVDPATANNPQYTDKIHMTDPLVSAAYNNALSFAKKQALQAATDGANSNDQSASLNGNPYAKKVYQDAYNAANSAYTDSLNNQNANNYSGNTAAAATYDAVQDAIADYVNNKPSQSNSAKFTDDASTAYQKAYQKAMQNEIADAIRYGQAQYEAGKSLDEIAQYGQNDSKSALGQVAKVAAQREQAGHDDALNGGSHSDISNDPSYQAGIQLVQHEKAGEQKALNNVNVQPDASATQAEKDGFKGTVDGYNQAATDGSLTKDTIDDYIKNNLADKSIAYRDAFKKSYLDGLGSAKAGADAATNNGQDSTNGQNGAAQKAQHTGFVDANNAFIDTLHGVNNTQDPNSLSSQEGAAKANQFLKAIQDAVNDKGDKSNTDANYQLGLNTAQLAIKNALADAKAGKKLPADDNDIQVPDGCDPTTYRDVYKAIFNGYTNGFSVKGDKTNNQNADYDIAFHYGYKKGTGDIPAPQSDSTAPTDFLNNTKKPAKSFASSFEAQEYNQQYQEAKDGFADGISGKNKSGYTDYYSDGYKAGQEALTGMKLAKAKVYKSHSQMLKEDGKAFANGYDGYLRGLAAAKRSLKENKKLSKKDLVGKDRVFVYTFKEGLKAETKIQKESGAKAGIKNANKRHSIPSNIYDNRSAAYAKSYIKAYKLEMKRRMPKYIYNVKTIFTHSRVKFSNQTRIKKYAYTKRYNSTVFKVTGIAYYKNGVPRYRLSNGDVVTAGDHVENAYYQHNFKQYKVIKPTGVLIHTAKKYTKTNVIRRLKRGETFKIQKVVKYHGLTRLYVGKGEYITSNKTYVQKIDR